MRAMLIAMPRALRVKRRRARELSQGVMGEGKPFQGRKGSGSKPTAFTAARLAGLAAALTACRTVFELATSGTDSIAAMTTVPALMSSRPSCA